MTEIFISQKNIKVLTLGISKIRINKCQWEQEKCLFVDFNFLKN
jgi:hypothetical protein